MTDRSDGQNRNPGLPGRRIAEIALTALVFALPSVSGTAGFLLALVPLPILYAVTVHGQKKGLTNIAAALALAAVATAQGGSLPALLFTCTLLPSGYAVAMAARKKYPPERAGWHGALIMIIVWVLFWTVYGLTEERNPYIEMREGLSQHLDAAYNLYSRSAELPQDEAREAGILFNELRLLISRLLPGLLLTTVIWTVWLNLVLGHVLLQRLTATGSPWPEYRYWRLPEYLVWLLIAALICLLLPGPELETLGMNMALITGVLYLFQGLAVCVHFLTKWSVPTTLRVIILAVVLLQAYGVVLLAMLGVTETWLNVRKTPTATTT